MKGWWAVSTVVPGARWVSDAGASTIAAGDSTASEGGTDRRVDVDVGPVDRRAQREGAIPWRNPLGGTGRRIARAPLNGPGESGRAGARGLRGRERSDSGRWGLGGSRRQLGKGIVFGAAGCADGRFAGLLSAWAREATRRGWCL